MSSKTQPFDSRQHMLRDTFEIFRYKDTAPQEVALHHHDFYEIYYFLSGSVQYNIDTRSYHLRPGDLLLISPMELHQPIFTKEKQSYERIVLWVNKHFLEQFRTPGQDLADCFNVNAPSHSNLLRPDSGVQQMLTYLWEQMLSETDTEEPFHEYYTLGCLTQALVLINRLALKGSQVGEAKENTSSVVYQVLNYINEHYHEDLTLDLLANKFFVSKYHLSREFNRLIGTSVYRYIIQKRLMMAKQMMSEGMPSSVVYQHCGFGDYSNFYRAFKSEYQISPKEFSARAKANTDRHQRLANLIRSSEDFQ